MDMKKLMQQAQKMQKEMEMQTQQLEGQIFDLEFNKVKIKISGALEINSITIAEDALLDKEILEDLITVAVNSAIKEIEEKKAKIYSKAQQLSKNSGLF